MRQWLWVEMTAHIEDHPVAWGWFVLLMWAAVVDAVVIR